MPKKDRQRSGKIGFGSVKAEPIDQGWQLVLKQKSVSKRLFVYDYDYVYGHELG